MNPSTRPVLQTVITKLESVKSNVMSDLNVQTAWETLNTRISTQRISVDERTMSSRDLVKELTLLDLNAQNGLVITNETGLHYQKMSNLCVYFATTSAVRHEMKTMFQNLTSTDINTGHYEFPSDNDFREILIPAGKSIDQLFSIKEFLEIYRQKKIPNALSFERMLSVLLGCVSPRPLSGLVKYYHRYYVIYYKDYFPY